MTESKTSGQGNPLVVPLKIFNLLTIPQKAVLLVMCEHQEAIIEDLPGGQPGRQKTTVSEQKANKGA